MDSRRLATRDLGHASSGFTRRRGEAYDDVGPKGVERRA
jgi:hypothetical protein